MKKLLLILLCLSFLFTSCKKEAIEANNEANNINNAVCPQNRFVQLDVSGSNYWNSNNNTYETADGNHIFCEYSGSIIVDDAYADLTFNSNTSIDLVINVKSNSKTFFQIGVKDIGNKSINVQYPIMDDTEIDLIHTFENSTGGLHINHIGTLSNSGCEYYSFNGFITFSQINLLPNNDINISANFEFTAWYPWSQSNNNTAECTDTIYITNGVIQNLSVPEQFL